MTQVGMIHQQQCERRHSRRHLVAFSNLFDDMESRLDLALRDTYGAWRALEPADPAFARNVGKLLAQVEKVFGRDELGKAPSLRDFGLHPSRQALWPAQHCSPPSTCSAARPLVGNLRPEPQLTA